MRLETKFKTARTGSTIIPTDTLEVEITVVVRRISKDAKLYWGDEPRVEVIGRCLDEAKEAFQEEWERK